jgi:hypothetical protein
MSATPGHTAHLHVLHRVLPQAAVKVGRHSHHVGLGATRAEGAQRVADDVGTAGVAVVAHVGPRAQHEAQAAALGGAKDACEHVEYLLAPAGRVERRRYVWGQG